MKALSFRHEGAATYGVSVDGCIFEAETGFRDKYRDLRAVLAAGELGRLQDHCNDASLNAADVQYLPTIANPDKIICVGVNYRPHVEEMGRDIPEKPVLFVRFPGSFVGHEQALVYPEPSEQYDFEGELAVVMGQRARRVNRKDAADYIGGYTCLMDGSARDWQRHTSQFTAGKNFRASGAMGPYLVTPDEIGEASRLPLQTRVNGKLMQQATLADLIFDIPALIEYCSTFADLLPGDVIATGTPGGVGAGRKPPTWLSPGDEVVVDTGPVGLLRNRVASE
ncbi:MAG: fumarylacetoacetate hydrolase family protein [Gammaproteobacteria bacterium]|nr:fumarylacetoacetate hydrolase family protein [Gammaproteobacteria bacterium]